MTPKEKAIKLYSLYYNRIEHKLSEEYSPHEKDVVKQCALIAVDEIIKAIDFDWMEIQNLDREHAYWHQVKQEIEKL